MKKNTFTTIWKSNFTTYGIVLLFFAVMMILMATGNLSRLMRGQLVPICAYAIMAASLNLTVGVLGELSLGHAGFVSIGCFGGGLAAALLHDAGAGELVCLAGAVLAGVLLSTLAGFLIGLPVLRLIGDYLAIVTLACCQIIKSLLTNLFVGRDESGLHTGFLTQPEGVAADAFVIRGSQGLRNAAVIDNFPAAVVLLILCLIIIYNLIDSKSGRAIMALRDNKIAARSIGINITSYKMMAFVVSAAMAGAAGALFGLSQATVLPGKFDFNMSVLILVFVVLGGLGNIRGSVIAAALLTILPEKLRFLADYRMIIYAVVLIVVMLMRNSTVFHGLGEKIQGLLRRKKTAGSPPRDPDTDPAGKEG